MSCISCLVSLLVSHIGFDCVVLARLTFGVYLTVYTFTCHLPVFCVFILVIVILFFPVILGVMFLEFSACAYEKILLVVSQVVAWFPASLLCVQASPCALHTTRLSTCHRLCSFMVGVLLFCTFASTLFTVIDLS